MNRSQSNWKLGVWSLKMWCRILKRLMPHLLHSLLDKKSWHIEILENMIHDQSEEFKHCIQSSMADLENQRANILRSMDEGIQTIQIYYASRGGQAPLQNSNWEARLESISDWIDSIETHFHLNFPVNRGNILDTLLDKLKSKFDNVTSGRRQIPPQCTPWQHWKSESCTIIGTRTQDQKSTRKFRCFDEMEWKMCDPECIHTTLKFTPLANSSFLDSFCVYLYHVISCGSLLKLISTTIDK